MPPTLDELQTAIGTSYRLDRELGRGGMATVYLARDTKHERQVALKVLYADQGVQFGPERFRREITTAAALQHPHILGVYDSGQTATGLLWFTMPYVEGETLRARLERERQLSVDDALRITREIASALAYAHARGVLHRDIKPENILLTQEGDALLADFGISRSLGAEPTTSLTQTGMVVGTARYMSPEQASGEREIGRASDVYSLGAVCYEMLAGEPPFTGATAQAVIAKMLTSPAPSVRILRPGVTETIDAALKRALAPAPADRWQTASDFATALTSAERVSPRPRIPAAAWALVLGLLIGGGVLFAWRSRAGVAPTASAATGPIRLAVLPFENVGDASDAYFADGMTDAVRDKMTSLPGLEIIGSTSSRQYRKTSKTSQQIGSELGARYLLEGRVLWAKSATGTSRVRVNTELIDAGSAADKWAAPFDAPLTDVFQVQGDIAGKVAQALQVALTPAARQSLTAAPTSNLAAYDAYLRAQSFLDSSPSPALLRRSISIYRQAILADSDFALAWAGLAYAYSHLDYNLASSLPGLADTVDHASARALALAPNVPETHFARATYYAFVLGENQRALTELQAGVAHGPNAQGLGFLARDEESLGRWDSAAVHAAQAITLDPRDPATFHRALEIALWTRQTAAAERAGDQALTIAPGRFDIIDFRMMAELQRGDLPAAHAILAAVPRSIDANGLVAFLGNYWDIGWALDSAHEALLLSTAPDSLADDTGRLIVLAQQYRFRGDEARMRIYADSARQGLDAELKRVKHPPGETVAAHALMLAYLGRSADATHEADGLAGSIGDARDGPYVQFFRARVYTAAGQLDRAVDVLEQILAKPFYVTPAWLQIDPNFVPLRGTPRFERLTSARPIS